jgi:hypothetical protein
MPGPDLSAGAVRVGAAMAARAAGPDLSAGAIRIGPAAAPARPRSWMDDVTGTMATFNEAIPFADEAEAGADTVRRLVTGQAKDLGEGWRQARQFQVDQMAGLRQEHPAAAALATGTGYGMQLIPALMTGGASAAPQIAAAAGAPTLAARAAQVAKLATTGAAYAAGNSLAGRGNIQERVQDADASMPAGAALGVAIPSAASAAGATARALAKAPVVRGTVRRLGGVIGALGESAPRLVTDAPPKVSAPAAARGEQRATAFVGDLMRRQGLGVDQLADNPQAGRGLTGAEALGPEAVQQVIGLSRRPGATGQTAFQQLRGRANDALERFAGDVEHHTGISPELATRGVDMAVKQGRVEAAPLYKAALEQDRPVIGGELPFLIKEGPVHRAMDHVQTWMRLAGLTDAAPTIVEDPETGLKVTGNDLRSLIQMAPTPTAWDLVKKRMDRMLELDDAGKPILTGKRGGENALIMQANQRLTANLRGQIPGYSAALDRAGDYLKIQEAYDRASNMLSNNWTAAKVQDFYSGLGTKAEKLAVRQAFARQLYDMIDKGTLRPNIFLGYGQGKRAAITKKLAAVFNPKVANALEASARAEDDMQTLGGRMRPMTNSVTSEAGFSGAEQDLQAEEEAQKRFLRGDLKGGLFSSVLGPAVRSAGAPGGLAYRDALGRLLLMSPQDLAAHMAGNVPPPPGPILPNGPVSRAIPPTVGLLSADRQRQRSAPAY